MTRSVAVPALVVAVSVVLFVALIAGISVVVQLGWHYTCTTTPTVVVNGATAAQGTADCSWSWWLG